jgi:CRP/FNR family transcriptional regulator, cyclic AMP receptor protein
VRYVRSPYVPEGERCHCPFEGASLDPVEELQKRANPPYDTIHVAAFVTADDVWLRSGAGSVAPRWTAGSAGAVAPPDVRLDAMRIGEDTKVAGLRGSPLFVDLSRKQLAQIARLSDDLDVPVGTVLCEQGSRGREFFVIIAGEAEVTRDGHHLATIGSGDFFGEIALLERVTRTATVTATTPLRFFVISAAAFDAVVETDPTIERKLLVALARRLLSMSGDAVHQ